MANEDKIGTIVDNTERWIPFDEEFPNPMVEVLLYSPENDGCVRVGYYDPFLPRIAISTIPLDFEQSELLEIQEKISRNNPTFNEATHWKYLTNLPPISREINAQRNMESILAQMEIERTLDLAKRESFGDSMGDTDTL